MQGDYELPEPFEVVFPANITKSLDQKCINVTTRDDSDLEGGHDFTVTIVSTTPKISDDSSLNVVIFDNEGNGYTEKWILTFFINYQSGEKTFFFSF